MPHPLVTQLRFTRTEWIRGLKAVTAEEAAGLRRRLRDLPVAPGDSTALARSQAESDGTIDTRGGSH
jgi:hypothetical protein